MLLRLLFVVLCSISVLLSQNKNSSDSFDYDTYIAENHWVEFDTSSGSPFYTFGIRADSFLIRYMNRNKTLWKPPYDDPWLLKQNVHYIFNHPYDRIYWTHYADGPNRKFYFRWSSRCSYGHYVFYHVESETTFKRITHQRYPTSVFFLNGEEVSLEVFFCQFAKTIGQRYPRFTGSDD